MADHKPGFGEISATQLVRLIGLPDAPAVLDVCLPEDVAAAPYRIPTALSASHLDLDSHIPALKDRHIVVVCQKGRKLSHGVAAHLRARGLTADVRSGGMLGWLQDGHPRIPLDRLPVASLWVTRHRPKIDRIACPWLIRRFVDPSASCLFVPPGDVLAVAERFNAIPFDVVGASFTHHEGHCTFDAMLSHFDIETPALAEMARIIRAADTDRLADAPQAAGLLAMSVGLSRMYRDDQAQLAAALPLYDAFYRWARDGQEETHDWIAEGQS